MALNRVTESVSFNTGITMAEYNDAPAGQTQGQTQKSILPGSTTVSEALEAVFPKDPTVNSQISVALAAAGSSPALRTSAGFGRAARRAMASLRGRKTKASLAAADEIETLLDDQELLDRYRASLLES